MYVDSPIFGEQNKNFAYWLGKIESLCLMSWEMKWLFPDSDAPKSKQRKLRGTFRAKVGNSTTSITEQ